MANLGQKLAVTIQQGEGRCMARELSFSGFLMSAEEWDELDESERFDYLQALIETGPRRADDWAYESYEISLG